jgi:hypothetical protein
MYKAALFILFIALADPHTHQITNKTLVYQNIVILSDLSNRVTRLPQKDTDEIFRIADYFKTGCVKPGMKIGDRSCLTFSALSQKVAVTIDIDQIKNLADKQSFVNSTGKFENHGLDQKIKEFKSTVLKTYKTTSDPGMDLISLLIEKIENESIVKENSFMTDGKDTTFIHYQNHIYVFTDGYLEYRDKKINAQFYFSITEIEKVRKYCQDNKIEVGTALNRNPSLGLPPYPRKKNQLISLHILETHERDKNLINRTFNHQTGVRDNEILEAVWRKWAKESGFKDLEWKKY